MRIRIAVVALITFFSFACHPVSARDVEGVVTDTLGHPRQYVCFGVDYNHLNFDLHSDADGKFVLKNVSANQTHWVASAMKRGLFVIPPDATHIEVKLQYGHAYLTGKVIDSQKRGVKGALVRFYLKRGDDEFFVDDSKTDAGGYFENYISCGNGLTLTARVMVGEGVVGASEPIALHDNQPCLELPDIAVPDKIAGESAPAETRHLLSGIVNDDQAKPIIGARVEVSWSLENHYGGRGVAQTDAQGRWHCPVPISVTSVAVKLFDAHHASSLFDRRAVSPPMEKLIDGSAISVMPRGNLVRGVVIDEAGKPIDDALILAASTGSNGGTLEPEEDVATHSAADGKFEIDGIPSGDREFTVYARDRAPSIVKLNPAPDLAPLNVTLKKGDDIHGVVVDQSGKPIAGAEISAYTWKTPDAGWHVVPRNPLTDAKGEFVLAHMPAGSFDLRYEKKGYNSGWEQDARATADPLRLTMYKPATLAGKVIDDASGLPVKSFTITAGAGDGKGLTLFTETPTPVKSPTGTFSQKLRWTSHTTQPVRVIAGGYLVADTNVNTTDGAPLTEIRLTKGEPYAAKVIRPETGEPVADAQVVWIGPKRQAFVREGAIGDDYTYSADIAVRTDANGDFKLPRTTQPGHVFIASTFGYALIARDDFHNGQSITVTPWATIHGKLQADANGAGKKSITLYQGDHAKYDDSTPLSWQFYAATNPDGTFTISHVPAIPLHIARHEIGVLSNEQTITPKPGETLDVQLGAGGQTVRGRIDAPADLPTDHFNTVYGVGKHYTGVYARRADAPPLTAPGTDEIGYAATLSPDGSFSIEGIPAGKYELIAKLHAPPMPQSCGIAVAMASTKVPFEVKDQPLELGSISLKARPTPTVGQIVPLQGKTLDDKAVSLSALQGHVVLLDFWASWCGPCKAETPRVKQLIAHYAGNEKFKVLGINLDYTTPDATRYVASEKITWPSLTFTGWGENNPVLQSLGVSSIPSFWLIDADGKLIARDIPPADLEAAVEKALR